MAKNIYIGNLNYATTEDEVRDVFAQYGTVESVNIIIDRDTNRSKGFGFVEMQDEDSAKAAISALNGTDLNDREIRVNEAKKRSNSNNRSFREDKRY